jgi:hypothetical protein
MGAESFSLSCWKRYATGRSRRCHVLIILSHAQSQWHGMAAKAKAALGHQSPTSPQSLRRPPSALLSKVIYPLNINEQLQKGRLLLLLRRTESASKQTSERLNE